MAGDWIPMRLNLTDDPAVIGIAAATGLDEFAVVGRLHRLWSWANQQTADGNAHGVTDSWVDRYACAAGFAHAMIAHGWLRVTKHGLEFPEFERWNSQGAKRRILATRRVQRCRNASRNAPSVNKTLTREEKRREEKTKKTPTPSGILTDAICGYCGATEKQTKVAHELDHFVPRCAGGSDDRSNRVLACHRCNQAKQGRIFDSLEECRDWLHQAYWNTNRKRWIEHRPFAFGGKPPAGWAGPKEDKVSSTPIPAALDTPEFNAAWKEWQTYRREKGKPVTDRAAAAQLAALAALTPPQAVACIAASIANDWQGLFPEKYRATPAPTRRGYETETERRLREAQMILGDDAEDNPT